jgi:hypothetical protein
LKESSIQSAILKALNQVPYTKAIKLHVGTYMPAGTPDILCVHLGRAYFFEVKQPEKAPTQIQQITQESWRDAGAKVSVVTTVKEAVEALLEV